MKTLRLVPVVMTLVSGVVWTGETPSVSFSNSMGMEMVRIEPGTFRMGEPGSPDHWPQQPAHDVTISRGFHISREEITLEQFREFRPGFRGTPSYAPYAAGVSWHDAVAFAEWLSKREGRVYRLPTEAEWEYVARAGGRGAEAWGVQRMTTGVREWVHDAFAEYPAEPQTDPVGPATGAVRVVRGGPLDTEERNFLGIDYTRPESRLCMPPSFGTPGPTARSTRSTSDRSPGLIGVWYDNVDFTEPQETSVITKLSNNWSNDPRGGGSWSARWHGRIDAPVTGVVTFSVDAAGPFRLEIGGEIVIDTWKSPERSVGSRRMERGTSLPIAVSWARSGGTSFHLFWEWDGVKPAFVPGVALSFGPEDEERARSEARTDVVPGQHSIGFRLVLGDWPDSQPFLREPPLNRVGVKQDRRLAARGPDPSIPYFRKRYYLPTPIENSSRESMDALGFHPSFGPHNHSPALEVIPNGDVLMAIYTSYEEYEPGVSIIASRLRHGADEWDMPSTMVDLVGVNDHAPLLWLDGGTLHLFWGAPRLAEGAFPFQWISSWDCGASWQPIRFPSFPGIIGSHSRQPINSAFRDRRGRMYVASDGSGSESVLWASDDDGETWFDTGGRTSGRHTSFVPLSDGRILGMGGKNTHIDEFMPKSVSSDGGRTYQVSKTPFPRQGSNQRPTLLRLRSGRLLFAGDFVYLNDGSQPRGSRHLGSYVALSGDDGETWHIRTLTGAQPHEIREIADRMKGGTLGYAVARQAPNGMIHLIGTMTNPSLHFEFNEAWILQGETAQRPDTEMMASRATRIEKVERFEERYPDQRLRATWSGGVADDGRFLLHGAETWYHENGARQWEVRYELGRRVGTETYWSPDGLRVWSWEDGERGRIWTQYWENGRKRAQSTWRDFKAEGPARRWERDGSLAGEVTFHEGRVVN